LFRYFLLPPLLVGCATSPRAPYPDLPDDARTPTPEQMQAIARAMGCTPGMETEAGCEHAVGLDADMNPWPANIQSPPMTIEVRLGRYLDGGEIGAVATVPARQTPSEMFILQQAGETWRPVARWHAWAASECRFPRRADGLELIVCVVRREVDSRERIFALPGPLGGGAKLDLPGSISNVGPHDLQLGDPEIGVDGSPELPFTLFRTPYALIASTQGPRIADRSDPRVQGFSLQVQSALTEGIPQPTLHDYEHFWVGEPRYDHETDKVYARLFAPKVPHSEDAEEGDLPEEHAEPPLPYVVLQGDRWVRDEAETARPDRYARSLPCPLAPSEHMPALRRHAAVYLPSKALCILHGVTETEGGAESAFETFTFDGERAVALAKGGPRLDGAARLVHDAVEDRVVLHARPREADTSAGVTGTWALRGSTWTRIGGEGPAFDSDWTLYFDAQQGRVRAVGRPGWDDQRNIGTGALEVWVLDGDSWRQEPPSHNEPPSFVRMSRAVYDPIGQRLVATAGVTHVSPANPTTMSIDQTWALTSAGWRRLSPERPLAMRHHQLVYDSHRDKFILLNPPSIWEAGRDGRWAWRAHGGGPRSHVLAAYHPSRRHVLAFEPTADKMWAWDGSSWTSIEGQGDRPAPRFAFGLAHRPDDGEMYVFGGVSPDLQDDPTASRQPLGDLWRWDGERWERVPTQGGPSGQVQGFVWHPGESKFYLMIEGATWTLDPASAQVVLVDEPGSDPPRRPPSTTRPALAYFPQIDAIVAGPIYTYTGYRAFLDGAWRDIPLSHEELSCMQRHATARLDTGERASVGEGVASTFDPVAQTWLLHGGSTVDDLPSVPSDATCELRVATD